MHAPDGFLTAGTAVATGAISTGAVAVALRQTRDRLRDKQIPLAGIAAPSVPTSVVVTSGVSFPDALGGAALAGRYGVPLLFSWPDSLPGPTRSWLRTLPNRIDPGFVLGGPAALRDAVAAQLSGCGVRPPDQSTPECRPA